MSVISRVGNGAGAGCTPHRDFPSRSPFWRNGTGPGRGIPVRGLGPQEKKYLFIF